MVLRSPYETEHENDTDEELADWLVREYGKWLDAGYAAAVGMIGMFCGVVNCPFAALLLAVEIFGGAALVPFAVTTALCYVFSGYFGLYSSQHILRSKVGTELIDRTTC